MRLKIRPIWFNRCGGPPKPVKAKEKKEIIMKAIEFFKSLNAKNKEAIIIGSANLIIGSIGVIVILISIT